MAFQVAPQPYQAYPAQGSLVQVAAAGNGLSLWLPAAPGQQPPVYLPGDMVQGKLRASVTSRTAARAVRLKFVAEARVHFHRGSGKERRDYRQTVALCPPLNITLQGADKHLGAAYPPFALEPGAFYEWDVCFQLPQGPLPGALYFQGCNGSAKVTYTLSGYLDIPNWPDASVSYDMNVAAAPLPITPQMAQPIDMQPLLGVNSCCCLFQQGSALLTLALPRGAAVPFIDGARLDDQQLLPVVVGVDNSRSSRALGTVTLKLKGEVHVSAAMNGFGGGSTMRWPFTIAKADIAPEGVPVGTTLPPRPVALPGLMVQRAPVLTTHTAQGAMVLQQPSVDIPNVLRVSYRLSLVVRNGCGSDLKAMVPLTFAPCYPERFAPPPQLPLPPMPMPLPGPSAQLPDPVVPVAEEVQPQFGLAYGTAPSAKQPTFSYEYGPSGGMGGAPLNAYAVGGGKAYPPAV